ncbi:hypothetical protein [Roseicyclus marinus]|uniref:hypothetical protein n=1 Tax=Roseicyclus marinus TaxID=2161673 RepID=UPI00240EAA23|nr:hypothetical protein [Roseicyclus marinus]MDG3040461.1 hypothetical protein [Roseicyclus marinus]
MKKRDADTTMRDWKVGAAIAAFAVFVLWALTERDGDQSDDMLASRAADREVARQLAAVRFCRDAIEAVLIAPSTAEHPRSAERVVRLPDQRTYEVSSYVDAANSFSAIIRTSYVCQAIRPRGTEEFQLVDLRLAN